MRHILILLVLLAVICAAPASADVTVGPTLITGDGHAPVPRFANLPQYASSRLVVPASTTVTLPPDSDYDAIEVSGTLRVSRDYDTTLRFVHLTVLPGGTLDVGTVNDPVLRKVDFVVKDRPLLTGTSGNLGPDPEQFGNGILVFGAFFTHGQAISKTWTTMQPAVAGATTITLSQPVNWQVGDELPIPDTRQMVGYPYGVASEGTRREVRVESPVTIAAINGGVITLSKTLDFAHSAFTRPDGSVLGLPYVANATRNIVFRSENPNGVRGHCMFMDMAHVDIYYASFLGLGRTTASKIDNFNSHTGVIGTNQIARYALHWHHVHGHADAQGLTGRAVGLFVDGSDIGKWGIVQHGTHDLLIADNVANRFVGGGYVTEDGYEIRGQYLRNFAMGCKGRPQNEGDGKLFLVDPTLFAPGAEGAGFWFHGPHQTIQGNVSINNAIGYQFMNMAQVLGRKVPGVPGGANDTVFDPETASPISFSGNVGASNMQAGIEEWRAPGWTAVAFDAWRNGQHSANFGTGEGGAIRFRDSRFVNVLEDDGTACGLGISSSAAYTGTSEFVGGEVRGHDVGLRDARILNRFRDCTLQNLVNIDLTGNVPLAFPETPWTVDIANVTFQNLTPATRHVLPEGFVPTPPPLPPNNPPVVSAITTNPPDVDPLTPGVQVYELSTVTYSANATDADGQTLSWTWLYQYGGTQVTHSSGSGAVAPAVFTYPAGPRSYTWTLRASDGTATTESSLTVEVVAAPTVPPPASIISRVTLPNGDVYEGPIPRRP